MFLIHLSCAGAYCHGEGAVKLQRTYWGQSLNSVNKRWIKISYRQNINGSKRDTKTNIFKNVDITLWQNNELCIRWKLDISNVMMHSLLLVFDAAELQAVEKSAMWLHMHRQADISAWQLGTYSVPSARLLRAQSSMPTLFRTRGSQHSTLPWRDVEP